MSEKNQSVHPITKADVPFLIRMRLMPIAPFGVLDYVAGLAGVLVPVTLDRFDQDPAVASSVFVTMLTDSMGFLAFLGLATMAGLTG